MADPSFCTAADVVFRSISLRPFLNHPGLDTKGVAFHKPINRVHTSQEALTSLAACPFEADRKDPPRSSSRQEKIAGCLRVHRGLTGVRAIPSLGQRAEPRPENLEKSMVLGPSEGHSAGSSSPKRFAHFSEEPDDPRVLVPAHRIGDAPKRKGEALWPSARQRGNNGNNASSQSGLRRAQKPALSGHSSLPSLSGKQMKLHTAPEPAGHAGPATAATGTSSRSLQNAGLLQFMLPSFGFPATVAEEAALEELFAQMPLMEDQVFGDSPWT
mmetsp:Transcript_54016/g.85949  ORF Transcript_54016/g.85949 Transcript_54016/m.85949 type:complete len:271 (-) Transcript_54016:22-834(-)